jgi:tol-pal system protein YbgF
LSRRFRRQETMSSRLYKTLPAVAAAAVLVIASQALAQDPDLELRIQRLENQLRQVTGQNEELQYRNRQLEERLRQLGGSSAGAAGAAQPQGAQPGVAAVPPAQQPPAARQPQPGYPQQGGYQPQPAQGGYPPQPQGRYEEPQIAAPAPIIQEPAQPAVGTRRRGDAFDPSQNPNAPGAPRALGGGQMPVTNEAAVGAPGGRGPGEPLDLAGTSPRAPTGATAPSAVPQQNATLTTLPPSATPRDEFDLGIGYMQRKDYALAEETMKNFSQKYPKDPLVADSQYWLGESYFQRQQYRDAAEAFLGVTTKYDKSTKAPDALLRLGQSLAALKEKEAACAALGEVTRKYPKASTGVKAAVDREQKRVKC